VSGPGGVEVLAEVGELHAEGVGDLAEGGDVLYDVRAAFDFLHPRLGAVQFHREPGLGEAGALAENRDAPADG
jgi:hypothetical protein